MTTRREHILDAVMSALAGTASVGSRIYRSRVTAISRSESPALLVEPVSDSCEQSTSLAKLDWTLQIRVTCIVRGDKPDEVADAVIESLHSRLMTDITLGGYAMDLIPTGTNFEMIDADQPAGAISSNYQIRYRTANDDLTTTQ